MARLFLLFILCVFVVSLAGSELVIDVQPNVISPEITPQLVINCSITNNEVQTLDLIKSLTLSRYNETIREFDELIALDSLTLNLKQFVRFKYSQISFGNRYITLILHNPTQFDARIYKCNATGTNSEGANISLFAKKAVEYETNSTALIEEIRRIKKDENYCSFKKDDLSDSKQRSRVYFSGSSDIIKERIEPLTLKCTFQVLKTDQNETSRLQSLYILHGSKMSYPPRKSCRDVNSTDERVVVTLTSGLKVMCDTKTDGGGWIIFQRRINGNVDFYRGWKEYRDGFGDYNIGEFYLGNENIYMLTSTGQYNLRIDLKYKNKAFFAQYSGFKILSEKEKYKLNIGAYSGNSGDNFSSHNNAFFTTFDRDNDEYSYNCAVDYTGAWWYHSSCLNCNLNGKWGSSDFAKGVNWYDLSRFDSSVSFTEMKIREI
uniref:Fibrinogen related protein 3.2-as1 n=1 Tax=Biomphalaria glabrata TaxID=6526 RepID=Q86H05_BIOGL|nr:fibrinogen related protein 3.2-as1 precursor [Biomphalaria glabrata]